jgi:FolB domain-containing protein
MDQILINDLLCRGVIGISDNERAQPQDILVNVVIHSDNRRVGQSDHIDDTVNYRTISKAILAYVDKASRHTVEALAEDLAQMILKEKGVLGVRVRVEKPGAVRFARSVGTEIERFPEK